MVRFDLWAKKERFKAQRGQQWINYKGWLEKAQTIQENAYIISPKDFLAQDFALSFPELSSRALKVVISLTMMNNCSPFFKVSSAKESLLCMYESHKCLLLTNHAKHTESTKLLTLPKISRNNVEGTIMESRSSLFFFLK